MIAARYQLGALSEPAAEAMRKLAEVEAVKRLWDLDFTLFQEDPAECADRLGWLGAPHGSLEQWDSWAEFAAEIAEEVDHIVVMGMGGSSLFPEVLTQTFASGEGFPTLLVLDTTDPAAIARVIEQIDLGRTFFIAASKSGSTLETRSHLALFRSLCDNPRQFAVITDPGSALAQDAAAAGVRQVFEADPDLGGRYSALSAFGMVPAAMIDVDGESLLESALDMVDALAPLDGEDQHNVGLALGAALGAAAQTHRWKLTVLLEDRLAPFGVWLEQLIAESTGKAGIGLAPCLGESLDVILATAAERIVVTIGEVDATEALRGSGVPLIELSFEEMNDLGAQVLLWEFGVALACRVMGINPFDQPDVETAKVASRALLDGATPQHTDAVSLSHVLAEVKAGDLLVLCGFVDPQGSDALALEDVRHRLGTQLNLATTLGFGPRFLHSTGQLHKGGPKEILVVQVVSSDPNDLAIPGQEFSFGELKHAQADGDLAALRAAGQRAFRVDLRELLEFGLSSEG